MQITERCTFKYGGAAHNEKLIHFIYCVKKIYYNIYIIETCILNKIIAQKIERSKEAAVESLAYLFDLVKLMRSSSFVNIYKIIFNAIAFRKKFL